MIHYNHKKLRNIAKDYNLRFVILHGSQATGRTHKKSDVDIAVVPETAFTIGKLINFFSDFKDVIQRKQLNDLDIKTLDKADPLFRYEVVRSGKLLYGNPSDYEDFKSVSFRMFEDAPPLFKLEKQLVEKYHKSLKKQYLSNHL